MLINPNMTNPKTKAPPVSKVLRTARLSILKSPLSLAT
jgi:hypothetical protein